MTAGELRKALEFADDEAPVILVIDRLGGDMDPLKVEVMIGNPGIVRIVG